METNNDIRIVVLPAGHVLIGRWSAVANNRHQLTDASVIRIWGTSKGLGQLALEGKQSGTVLDKIGTVQYHDTTVIFDVKCTAQWIL